MTRRENLSRLVKLYYKRKTGFLVVYNNVLVIVDNCLIESKTNSRLYVPPFLIYVGDRYFSMGINIKHENHLV